MNTRAAHVMLAAVVAVALSCGDATDPSVPGTYTLRQVGHQAVPAVVHADDQGEVAVTSAHVELFGDLTFIDVKTYRITPTAGAGSTQVDTALGTYSHDGDKLNFLTASAQTYQMTWEPSHLTYYAEGVTFFYTK